MFLSFEVTLRKTSGLFPGTHFQVTVRADVGPPVCSIARLDNKDGWDLSLTEPPSQSLLESKTITAMGLSGLGSPAGSPHGCVSFSVLRGH